MADSSILSQTLLVPNGGMSIPVADPAQPPGLKNGRVAISALVEFIESNFSGGGSGTGGVNANDFGAGLTVTSGGQIVVNFGTSSGQVADGGELTAVSSGGAQNTSAISALTTSLGTTNSTLATVSSGGTQNTSSISALTTSLGTTNSTLNAVSSGGTQNTSSISALTTSLGTTNSTLATVSSGGTQNTSSISALTTSLGATNSTLTAVSSGGTQNTSSISALTTSLGATNSTLTAVSSGGTQNTSSISALTTSLGTTNSTLATVSSGGTQNTSAIAVNSASISALTTSLTVVSGGVSTNSAAIASEITTRANNDSTLSASINAETSRAQAAEAGLLAGMKYVAGGWNAATNTPALSNASIPANGTAYLVTTPGTTSLGGVATWNANDTLASNGTTWLRFPFGTAYAPIANPTISGPFSITGGYVVALTTGFTGYARVGPDGLIKYTEATDGSPAQIGASATFAGVTTAKTSSLSGRAIVGPDGLIKEMRSADGSPIFSGKSAVLAGLTFAQGGPPGLSVVGPDGLIYGSLIGTVSAAAAVASYSTQDVANRNSAALARSMIVKGRVNTSAQRPVLNYNLRHTYGQSESEGSEASVPLTVTQPFDCLMLGQSDRPQALQNTSTNLNQFLPVGDSLFHPLIATFQNATNGNISTPKSGGFQNVSTGVFNATANTFTCTGATGNQVNYPFGGTEVITPVGGGGQPAFDLTQIFTVGAVCMFSGLTGGLAADISEQQLTVSAVTATQLTFGGGQTLNASGTQTGPFNLYNVNNSTSFMGEDTSVSALNFYRDQQLAFRGLAADPTRLLVSCNCSVGGQTVAQLSKGGSDYPRLTDSTSRVIAAAQAVNAGNKVTVYSLRWIQGGNDCTGGTTLSAYQASYITLIGNYRADVMALTGQTKPPFWFTTQVSGGNVTGDQALNIAQAQLNVAMNPPFPDVYMVGPTYPVPDVGLHMSPNGYRWLGLQEGKVEHRVIDRGEGWMPVYPTSITYRGAVVMVDFHVPEPPLQMQPFYNGFTPTSFADWGFLVTDAGGVNPIIGVIFPLLPNGQTADTMVQITCARTIVGPATLQYGDPNTHSGGGNLCDSDPTTADEVFIYNDFSGQFPGENISSLVGNPYPLWNWCVLFNMAITAG